MRDNVVDVRAFARAFWAGHFVANLCGLGKSEQKDCVTPLTRHALDRRITGVGVKNVNDIMFEGGGRGVRRGVDRAGIIERTFEP